MRRYLIFLITLTALTSNAYAYYCSTGKGNGYINIGDSMQKVQSVCGAPDSTSSSNVGGSKLGMIEYWTYTTTPLQTLFGSTPPKNAVTQPPPVTFEIVDNKVVSITSDNKQVQSSNDCTNHKYVSVGASADTLLQQCGQPTVQKSENKVITTPNQAIETWTYNASSGAPIVLEFTNGVLSKTE